MMTKVVHLTESCNSAKSGLDPSQWRWVMVKMSFHFNENHFKKSRILNCFPRFPAKIPPLFFPCPKHRFFMKIMKFHNLKKIIKKYRRKTAPLYFYQLVIQYKAKPKGGVREMYLTTIFQQERAKRNLILKTDFSVKSRIPQNWKCITSW